MKIKLLLSVLFAGAVLLMPSSALAAKPDHAGKPKPPSGGGSGSSDVLGYDVSYPQCGKRLPSDFNFAVVGVNGGLATTQNPCLLEQLNWAQNASGVSNQDSLQLYVNTANPAQESIYSWDSWPTSGSTPYGECSGVRTNDQACSWQYGWNRSVEAIDYFVSQAVLSGIETDPSKYFWWLDVETMNSWQSGSDEALQRNVAALEGFAAYYLQIGARLGLYSTAYQWGVITGNPIDAGSNLQGLPNWRPSGSSLKNAKNNCNVEPLTTGGEIYLTQYVKKNLDHNYSCIN